MGNRVCGPSGWALYTNRYYLTHPWNFLNDFFYWGLWKEILSFWQRGWHGWGRNDVSMTSAYLAEVISEMLVYERDHRHGSPAALCDYDESGWPRCAGGGCGCVHERWTQLLNEMIDGFQTILEEDEDVDLDGWKERRIEREIRYNRGMEAFAKWANCLGI